MQRDDGITVETAIGYINTGPRWLAEFVNNLSGKVEEARRERDAAEAKADAYIGKLKYDADERVTQLLVYLDDTRRERDAARAVLKKLERSGGYNKCPLCLYYVDDGHAYDCELAANLPPEPEAPPCA